MSFTFKKNYVKYISESETAIIRNNGFDLINNESGEITNSTNYDVDILRFSFKNNFVFYSAENSIYKQSLNNSNQTKFKLISFDDSIQTFAINKNILIVSLYNNDILYCNFETDINKMILFSDLSVLCFEIDKNSDYVAFLSIENGYELIDLRNYQKRVFYRYDLTENFVYFFESVIKFYENLLMITLECEILIFEKRLLKKINTLKINLDVNTEIINYVNFLQNGQFILAGTNKGKIFVFNFINKNLIIKYDLKDLTSLSSNNEKIIYLTKHLNIKEINPSLTTDIDDDNYFDDKMLDCLQNLEKNNQIENEKKKETDINQTLKRHFEKYNYKKNKFVINK
jgi:hypothetical protein